jgi:hypothetical protein
VLFVLALFAFFAIALPDAMLGVAWPFMRVSFNQPLAAMTLVLPFADGECGDRSAECGCGARHGYATPYPTMTGCRAFRLITGVIDFERASFDDPMADLAQTLRNATFHQPSGAEELAAAYGVDAADQERLAIHDLLHTLAQRVWISTDRPTGWRSSVRQLDAHLHCVSQRA